MITALLFNDNIKSQSIAERLKRKVEQKVNDEADKILDGKKKDNASKPTSTSNSNESVGTILKTETNITGDRPKLSEISDADFVQNSSIKEKSENDTRFRLSSNLFIDMKGKYPLGYFPKWRFINEKSRLKVTVENWMRPTSNVRYEDYPISIVTYNNKPVIRLHPFMGCECFADIVVKGNVAVINETPQTFQIANFRRILNERSTGEPCNSGTNWSNSWETNGGLEGKITLSANENGDLLMDFMLENYSSDHKNMKGDLTKPSQVSRRYIAKGITIENEMSPEKANDIVAKEKEAKERMKQYMAKMTKQSDSLQKVIASKYPQKDCKECFSRQSNSNLKVTPTTIVTRNGYGDIIDTSPSSEWDINTKTDIKNKCNYDLLFVGIQQLYDEQRGYYLVDVTKTMEKGYIYNSEQGMMGSLFTSLIGGGSEFNLAVQDKYYPNSAMLGAVQWLKVIKK